MLVCHDPGSRVPARWVYSTREFRRVGGHMCSESDSAAEARSGWRYEWGGGLLTNQAKSKWMPQGFR